MYSPSTSPEVPHELVTAAVPMVSQLTPKELNRVIRLIRRRAVKDSDLVKAVLDRIHELGTNVPLSVLIPVHRMYPSSRLAAQIASATNAESINELWKENLISLIGIEGVNPNLLAFELSKSLSGTSSYAIASIVNGFSKLQPKLSPSVERLFDLIAKELVNRLSTDPLSAISPRDISLITNGYARYGPSRCPSSLFAVLTESAIRQQSNFSPVSISILLHAIAKSGIPDYRLFDVFAEYLLRNTVEFRGNGKAAGMVLYAFGKCDVKNDMVLKSFAELVKRDLQCYCFQSLAAAMYGFARLGFTDAELWELMSEEVVYRGTVKRNSKTSRYTSTDVAMMAKAFSRVKTKESDRIAFVLFEMMKKQTLSTSASSAVEMLSALTRLDTEKIDGRVMSWISRVLPPVLPLTTPTELYTITSSLCKMGYQNKYFFPQLLDRIETVSSVGLRVKFLGKLARMQLFRESLVRDSIKLISSNLTGLTADELVVSLSAISQFNFRDTVFTSRVTQAIAHQLRDGGTDLLSSAQLSTLVVAAARLRIVDEVFYDLLMKTLFERSAEITSEQAVCNILFAFATAIGSGDWVDQSGWFTSVSRALLGNLIAHPNLTVEGIRQLQVYALTLDMRSLAVDDIAINELLKRVGAMNTFKTNAPSIEQSSVTHREVSKYLNLLGLIHRNEVTIGPFSLDIYLPETKTVIEIDGPHHFFRDSIFRTSSSAVKHRILSHLGYKIEHVAYQEWLQCTSDVKGLAYCSNLADRLRIVDQLEIPAL